MNGVVLSTSDWVQIIVYFGALLLAVKPMGVYMARVYSGEKTFLSKPFGLLERGFYRLAGLHEQKEMTWVSYALSLIVFSVLNFMALYGLLRLQSLFLLPHEKGLDGFTPALAFNTAVSFVTNTDWQSYTPEKTIGIVAQMAGLTVQNFLSAATGMAVLIALSRGFTRKSADTIGNFWVDLVRGVLYILLPLAFVFSLILVSQGVVQTWVPSVEAVRQQPITLSEPADSASKTIKTQTLPLGPVASQEAIKQLGTNGGGFYAANAAHPYENPTPLSNFLEMLAILLLPASLCITFGRLLGRDREGWSILIAMLIIFVPLTLLCISADMAANPLLANLDLSHVAHCNMEGKETRLGCVNAGLWAAATTATSNGSINAMHDSFMPLAGLVPLVLIQFSDVVFGGVGTGLCAMILFVVLAVFITGLMVGRTPEYLNKKIGAFQIKMISLAILIPHLAALIGTAIAVTLHAGQGGAANPYAQGFSEILYAFSSASNNNGSAFAGLQANTPFYNTALGLVMLCARYGVIIPLLALAGSLASQKAIPSSNGTLDTTSPLFIFVLVGVVILVGVLTFVPALALGPVAEHFHLMHVG